MAMSTAAGGGAPAPAGAARDRARGDRVPVDGRVAHGLPPRAPPAASPRRRPAGEQQRESRPRRVPRARCVWTSLLLLSPACRARSSAVSVSRGFQARNSWWHPEHGRSAPENGADRSVGCCLLQARVAERRLRRMRARRPRRAGPRKRDCRPDDRIAVVEAGRDYGQGADDRIQAAFGNWYSCRTPPSSRGRRSGTGTARRTRPSSRRRVAALGHDSVLRLAALRPAPPGRRGPLQQAWQSTP